MDKDNFDANISELTLGALSREITDTAVDIFVYDTSKDSDGGAWRKRTQATSWYNETLNTATRGSRKEFPAVAVIVAEATDVGYVTIYDGDDPDMPMWMVLSTDTQFVGANTKSVSALNGIIAVGIKDSRSTNSYNTYETRNRLDLFHFISDKIEGSDGDNSGSYFGTIDGIANRDTLGTNLNQSSVYVLVRSQVNDVAMTVLPNAPIDPATGLPVPTIAVATDGGVSVIKDDGTVVDITQSHGGTTSVDMLTIDPVTNAIIFTTDYGGSGLPYKLNASPIPSSDRAENSAVYNGFQDYFFQMQAGGNITVPHLINTGSVTESVDINVLQSTGEGSFAVGEGLGLDQILEDRSGLDNSMIAYTASDYATGWMNGDIKLATLSDTDDTDVTGSEFLTPSEWSLPTGFSYSSPNLSYNGSGGQYSKATERLSGLTVGQTYTVSFNVTAFAGSTVWVAAHDQGAVTGHHGAVLVSNTGHKTFTFKAETAQDYIVVQNNSATQTFTIADFSVRLAEEDRSVNGNGLQVFGTVTKNPVATDADLVGYTFSGNGTDYLQQPYNSDLNVGTGDFAFSFWFNVNTTAAKNIFELGGPTGGSTAAHCLLVQMQATGVLRLYIRNSSNNAWLAPQLDSASINDGSWHCVSLVRRSGTVQWFVDGVAGNSDSTTFTGSNLGSTNALLRLGTGIFSTNNAFNGSLALFRVSATAPSPEQIAKIYEDEKVLFQDGAQATLYGSSDAVTALAYDDSTELLHVGTSAGRSVFQGLRRVDNTTDAVGAAISASNSLVAED
jgi:hypothetical protein